MAQGDGKFSLPVYAKGQWWPDGGYVKNLATWTSVEMTWDRTFGYLGLRMMQEADEPTLENDLGSVVHFDHGELLDDAFRERATKSAKASDVKKFGSEVENVEVSDEDFQTILLQFDALGLIQHSQKKNRSVKDTANYWTLTPYGHTRLVQLRALQAGEETLLRKDQPDSPGGDEIGAPAEAALPHEPPQGS